MTTVARAASPKRWPALPWADWKETAANLHMWTQIVGKIRLACAPWVNHSWHVTLYVTPRGLTTSTIPHGQRTFSIDFDFLDQRLAIVTCDGDARSVALEPMTTARFHERVFQALGQLDLPVRIFPRPNEVAVAVPFPEQTENSAYDAGAATRFWQALVQVERVFSAFRARFIGKSSPVHFFWGSFDLAVTRFSGRPAPEHPGGFPNLPDAVTREAYSHEVSSAGFWPGGDNLPEPVFFSYAYPEPAGFRKAAVAPAGARFHEGLGEFVLTYETVRTAADPDAALLEFLQSTYEAAADGGRWDREALERTFRR